MSPNQFFNKKVVFKYPIDNEACFKFVSSFELIKLIRLATEEEEKAGRRLIKFCNIEKYWINELRVDK